MNSGIYIKNIFDVVSEKEINNFVNDTKIECRESYEKFAKIPQRATKYSAGYDLSVLCDEVIPPHSSHMITFGNSIAIDNPYVTAIVVPRSSLAKKRGLIIFGGPHFIYAGTGHSCMSLKFINYSDKDVELKAGDKIAQVVFLKYPLWITGEINIQSKFDNFITKLVPDPLDEKIMSPLLSDNMEKMPKSNIHNIDQTDRVSYYFQAPYDTVLDPCKVTCIMTGVRCKMGKDQVLLLKNAYDNPCVELANSIGVIDADYYDNPDNGGEIGVLLLNRGSYPITVNAGDVIASGALYYYEKADGDEYVGKRVGGFGSTDKK